VKCLLDTNVVLYLLGGRLADPLEPGDYCVSIISEMELLSYPSLGTDAEAEIRAFLSAVTAVGLTQEIKDTAVDLRRRHGLKLPDAIVAATAVVTNAELLTNDAGLLKVPGVSSRSLPLKENRE